MKAFLPPFSDACGGWKLPLYSSYQHTEDQLPRSYKNQSIFTTFDEMQVLYKKKQILTSKE